MKTSTLHVVCAAILQLALTSAQDQSLGCWDQRTDTTVGQPARGDNSQGAGSVVYTLFVPQRQRYTITTCNQGTDYDSYLTLYGDPFLTDLIAYNDDDCDIYGLGLASTIRTDLSAGTYYVVVEGYSSTHEGTFWLSTECSQDVASIVGMSVGIAAGVCVVCVCFIYCCRAARRKNAAAVSVNQHQVAAGAPQPVLIQAPAPESSLSRKQPLLQASQQPPQLYQAQQLQQQQQQQPVVMMHTPAQQGKHYGSTSVQQQPPAGVMQQPRQPVQQQSMQQPAVVRQAIVEPVMTPARAPTAPDALYPTLQAGAGPNYGPGP